MEHKKSFENFNQPQPEPKKFLGEAEGAMEKYRPVDLGIVPDSVIEQLIQEGYTEVAPGYGGVKAGGRELKSVTVFYHPDGRRFISEYWPWFIDPDEPPDIRELTFNDDSTLQGHLESVGVSLGIRVPLGETFERGKKEQERQQAQQAEREQKHQAWLEQQKRKKKSWWKR